MNPEEAERLIGELASLDFSVQADREEALRILNSLPNPGQLPTSLAFAVSQTWEALEAGGGVASMSPDDFRKRSEYLFFLFDMAPINRAIGTNMWREPRADRYIQALDAAARAGDPAAVNRLAALVEFEKLEDDQRATAAAAIEASGLAPDIEAGSSGTQPTAAARMDPAQTMEPEPQTAAADTEAVSPEEPPAAPPAATGETGSPSEAYDRALGVTTPGVVGFYGVPLRTMGEDGQPVDWAAIVGDQFVSPRYAEGYSRQPGRFGFNNEEDIARIQMQMEAAGLLQPGSYAMGVWDATTAGRSNTEGWRSVLAFANMNGLDWEDAFDRMYDAGTDAAARGLSLELSRLNRQPFFADPADLRSRTRNFLLQMGRMPTQISDEELDSLTDQALYGAQAARRATIESQIQQRLGGAVGPDGEMLPTTTRADEFEMDPVAYFDRELEKLTAREMEARTEQQLSERGSRDFQSIINGFGSGLGG